MNISPRLLRLVFATAAIGTLVSFAADEPGVERWNNDKRVKHFSSAKKVTPKDLVTLQCKDCPGTVAVDANHLATSDEGRAAWYAVGAKHTCTDCKGDITVAQGKDDDSMKIDCSKCGDDSVTCRVARAEK